MILKILGYFLLFIMYSFIGWCMETSLISIKSKRFINRGFLVGPYCPIYGFGALIITIFLGKYSYDAVVLFVMAVVVCGIIEYLTSLFMEKIFNARWWDYSNRKFNFNGRICLLNLLAFGTLGLLVIYILNPFFIRIIEHFGRIQMIWSSSILLLMFLADFIISFTVIINFRKINKDVNMERKEDNTEQISKMVRELFAEKSILHRRIINAYPKVEAIKLKVKEIREKVEKEVKETREAINEKKENIKKNIEKGYKRKE